MTERPCDDCGKPFTAKTKRAKFCSTACRVRANRRPSKQGAAVTAAADAAPADPAPTAPAAPPAGVYAPGALLGQTIADLAKADVLTTIPGRAAVALAYRIESPMESGSSAASMTRELSRLVEEAMSLAPKQADQVDQLGDAVASKLRLVQ